MFLRSYILILQNVVTKMSLQCSYAREPGLALSNFSLLCKKLCIIRSFFFNVLFMLINKWALSKMTVSKMSLMSNKLAFNCICRPNWNSSTQHRVSANVMDVKCLYLSCRSITIFWILVCVLCKGQHRDSVVPRLCGRRKPTQNVNKKGSAEAKLEVALSFHRAQRRIGSAGCVCLFPTESSALNQRLAR